ncbi:sigma factor-like helix-turn-helix DNA-binding protein [Candidatus Seongchinamella marina]|nr:sigma factor-like helix-turn-helix DNA-binding protein [Candidatus Seongchinamella marina]
MSGKERATYREIGQALGMSTSAVQRIEASALVKLRHHLERQHGISVVDLIEEIAPEAYKPQDFLNL